VTSRALLRAAVCLAAGALVAHGLVGCAASSLPAVHSEAERLPVARRLMEKRDFTNAIELLKVYVQNNAGSAAVDEGIVLLGECYLRSKDWISAAGEFERLLRDYPESDSAAAAAFLLGEAYWGQSRGPDFDQDFTEKALAQWGVYLRDYPGHWRGAEAERRVAVGRTRLATKLIQTGDLYFKQRLFEPAQVYYRQVTENFGDTPLLGDALLGIALCDAHTGKAAEAIAALRELETRFAGRPLAARAARERQRLERHPPKPAEAPRANPAPESAAGSVP
jgi:outer membrane protein assembly factor BamD